MSKLEKKPKGVCLMCKAFVTAASIGGIDVMRSFFIGVCTSPQSTHYHHWITQLHQVCDCFDRRDTAPQAPDTDAMEKSETVKTGEAMPQANMKVRK